MKICTSYRQLKMGRDKVQEFRYPIQLLNVVLENLESDYHTIYIIEIPDMETQEELTFEQIHDLAKDYSNLFFDFHKFEDFQYAASESNERKYMYHFPVNTYMDIQYLLQYPGLAAITLEEPLTFDMERVHKTIKEDEERNIQIRIYPAIGKPSRYLDYKGDNGINHFWVLPQHIKLYEPYVDVIDIIDKSETREHALVSLYTNPLPYIVAIKPFFKNVDSKVIGAFVDEDWAMKRLNCQQTCLHKGIHCTFCLRQDSFFNFILEHPERAEQLAKRSLPDFNVPTNPDLLATD